MPEGQAQGVGFGRVELDLTGDVLEAQLGLLAQSAQLSARGKRACKEALKSLARKEGQAPAAVPA